MSRRELTPPPALADIDLAAHRERAKRALVLHLGGQDLSRSPTEWEAQAEAVLVLLERYGIAPLWVFDPAMPAAIPKPTMDQLRRLFPGKIVYVPRDIGASQLPAGGFFFPDDVGGCE